MANRIVLAKDGLRGAVTFAQKVMTRRSPIPVLSHLRIVGGDQVRIEATDLENRLSIALPRLGGEGDFEAVLPARALAQYLKGDAESEISLAADGVACDLDGKRARIVGLEPSDYPSDPGPTEWARIAGIAPGELERALAGVSFARSVEPVHYALTGTLLEISRNGKKGFLVASDGKRLSAWPFTPKEGESVRAIVNQTASLLASALAKRAQGEISVEKSGEADPLWLRFSDGDSWIVTRAMDGHFPEWQAVVPSSEGRSVYRTSPEALARAIESAEFAVSEKSGAMEFRFGPSEIQVFARSLDRGEATGTAPAHGPGGSTIVWNASYVSEYLASLPRKTPAIEIELGTKDQAAVFRVPGVRAVYVLMPLSVTV